MDADKWEGKNPWLGLSTYQEGIRLYGRDTEISTLMDIVCNNLAMVVFGRSGIGKSSLIHAGLSPEIRKKGMMPIYIRLEHNTNTSYVCQIEKAVCKELKEEDRLGEGVPRMGLWDFFHRNDFYNKEHQQIIPVIIIDQFEEIYTLADADHKHLAQELFEELADLLNNIKPAKVTAYEDEATKFTKSKVEMGDDDVLTFRIRSAKRLNYIDNSNFHLVICLREDYLYYLERNTSKIPSFKINRFSLQALNRQSASDVIILPKPGLFSTNEASDIISKISTFNDEGKEEIDPTILSIFLFKYFNSKGNVRTDNIIGEYYSDETHNISRSSLAFLEDNLITGEGFRHIVPYNDALANGVTKQELNQLIASRILTVETRKKHKYIEFSHDVICPIAKEHRERRKIDEQARKLRQRILAATTLIAVAVIIIGSFLYLRHQVKEKDRKLTYYQAKNNSLRAHYMIVQGDVLDAIKLLLNTQPDLGKDDDCLVLPETEQALNEAYDSLYSDYACIAILEHQDDVTTAEFSDDKKYIVTASGDGVCRIWNAQSGELQHELKSGYKNVIMTGASLSKDGCNAIASFSDGAVLVWDVANEIIKYSLQEHHKAVNYACFSPDGLFVLTASSDSTVRLWDATTGEHIKTIVKHDEVVNCAVFCSDGSKVITSSDDGTSVVYDLNTNQSKPIFSSDSSTVEYAEFNSDDTQIAIVTDNAVFILNAETGNTVSTLKGHGSLISSASFSPDGHTIATSSYDKKILLWDIPTSSIIHTYTGHSNIVKDVVFSPNGKYLLSTSSDNEARLWNVFVDEGSNVIHSGIELITSATYSPNGEYIAALSIRGKAAVWNSESKEVVYSFRVPEPANSITFSNDSKKVVVTTNEYVRIFDIINCCIVDSIRVDSGEGFDYALFVNSDNSIVAISHNNRTIMSSCENHSLKYPLNPNDDSLTCISFNPGSLTCLLASRGKTYFSQWDLIEGTCQKTYNGHTKSICSAKYSHDGQHIISSSSDNTAIIWDYATCSVVNKLKGHSSQVYFAEFSFDDHYVITASEDGFIKLWNTETAKEVATRIRRSSSSPQYTYMFNPVGHDYFVVDGSDIRLQKLYSPKKLVERFIERFERFEFTPEEKENYSIY